MGYTAQPGSQYNVIGSFNQYFQQQVTAKGVPDWLASATGTANLVNFDFPQEPVGLPSFSVTHFDPTPTEVAEGRNLDPGWKGVRQDALAEVDCWLSYRAGFPNQVGQLRQMRDMVARVFGTGAAIPILDLYGTTGAPTANGTIIRADPTQGATVGPDLNPDVMRKKLLVPYYWMERITAG